MKKKNNDMLHEYNINKKKMSLSIRFWGSKTMMCEVTCYGF